MHDKSLQSGRTVCDHVDCRPRTPLVHGILQARTLPCSSPGDLPNPGIQPACLICLLHWQAGSLPLAPPGKPVDTLEDRIRDTVFRFWIFTRICCFPNCYMSVPWWVDHELALWSAQRVALFGCAGFLFCREPPTHILTWHNTSRIWTCFVKVGWGHPMNRFNG